MLFSPSFFIPHISRETIKQLYVIVNLFLSVFFFFSYRTNILCLHLSILSQRYRDGFLWDLFTESSQSVISGQNMETDCIAGRTEGQYGQWERTCLHCQSMRWIYRCITARPTWSAGHSMCVCVCVRVARELVCRWVVLCANVLFSQQHILCV